MGKLGFITLALVCFACGPSARPGNGPGDDDGVDAPAGNCTVTPENTPAACSDGVDNDCNDRTDCGDPGCSGVGECPVCGAVENPEAQPLALPDGVSSGTACSTDAQCTDVAAPNCVAKECHASYTSTLNFIGFPMNTVLSDPTKLLAVCVKMEHTWLRDLQMELITPDGNVFILQKFIDRSGGEIFLGHANDSDPGDMPMPGDGYDYCWTPTAAQDMYTAAMETWDSHQVLPAGDYKSSAPWSALSNATLNGMWTMRVTDLWGIDNGFMFAWSIKFDPSLVSDCSGPIIE
jgi:hypothetical protein